MKKLGRVTILTLLIIILSTLLFVACDKGGKKQVPVYKGMTISSNFARASATMASDVDNSDLQGEQGRVEGDYDNRDDDLDKNKPFEDPNAPSIENKANSTLDVVGAAESIYYADKNQDIFITIRLSNPDSYEIVSFILNGKYYSNHMFEDGSDMENFVLKVNIGDVGGIHDYTIDSIKYVDGTYIKDVRMDGDRTVKAGVRASDQTYVTVTNEQKTMTSISFDAQVVDSYSLIEKSGGYAKAVLYDGVNMTSKDITVGEKTSVTFDNLTQNTIYQYGVVALYDDLSGNGAKLNTLYKKAVYTDTIVLFKDIEVGQETLSWGYLWNDAVENKTITALELMHNDEKLQDVDVTATRLDGLKSNNEYTLKATYKNLQNQDETIAIDFVTCAKATPSVTIRNLSSTQNTIECDIAYTDVDVVGRIESVVLFKGETQVATTNGRTHVVFDTLECDAEYTLVVTYKYDLNDGKGEQTATQIAKRYTTPQFELVEAKCANTSAVSKGDVIYFEAKVVNPSGVAIERIKINDRYYTPSSGTTKTSIIVNITVEDQFEGGNTALDVTEIQGTLRGQKVTFVPTQSNVANVFVNGELGVKSIKIVDEDGKECDMVVQDKQYYYIVSFGNKTGYSIDEINIYEHNYTLANGDYTMQDTQTAKIPVMFTNGVKNISVSNVKYSNSSLGEKSKEIVGVAVRAVCVTNEVPIVVSTAEQLKNMDDWGYYVLENDIDLAGTEWKNPSGFRGYFDGQGYAIKNMNFVGTVENNNFYWGLFSSANGVIKNLSLSGRLIVTMNRTDKNAYWTEVGGLCAYTYGLTIENVVNNVNLSVTNNCDGDNYAGGLVGCGDNRGMVTITDSYNTGDVSATGNSDAYAGGLVGYGDDYGTVTITDSYNTGSVGALHAGGLVGYGYTVTITDSYNTGDVSATGNSDAYAGGLVGYGDDDGTVTITDSYNTGSVSATGNSDAYAGGLVGYGDLNGTVTITGSYNTGSVSATSNSYNSAGGLVGYCYGTVTITDSCNTGSVSATSNSYNSAGGLVGRGVTVTITGSCNTGSVSALHAGGLVGYGSSVVTITDSYNTGSVSATGSSYAHAGGLVGHGHNAVTITGSYNTGSVSATSAGGLVGHSDTVMITDSYNTGSVSATHAGGLVGIGYTATITDSYNTGDVSAKRKNYVCVGGLVGLGDTVTIMDSYNTGSVSATGNTYVCVGGLVGCSDNNGTVTITDSYNTGDVSVTNSEAYAGGLFGYGNVTVTITNSFYTLPENSSNNYGEKKDSVAEIVAIMENLWDSSIWDFDNLDENGNPTLKLRKN